MLLKWCIASQYITHWQIQSLIQLIYILKAEWISFQINYFDLSNHETQLFYLYKLLVCNRTILLIINRIVLTRWCYKKVAKKTLSNWYFVSILQNLISLDNSILSTWPYHTKFIALVPWCPHIIFCFWRIISNKSVKATYFLFIMCWFPRKRKVNIYAMNIISTRHVTGLLEVVSLAIKI